MAEPSNNDQLLVPLNHLMVLKSTEHLLPLPVTESQCEKVLPILCMIRKLFENSNLWTNKKFKDSTMFSAAYLAVLAVPTFARTVNEVRATEWFSIAAACVLLSSKTEETGRVRVSALVAAARTELFAGFLISEVTTKTICEQERYIYDQMGYNIRIPQPFQYVGFFMTRMFGVDLMMDEESTIVHRAFSVLTSAALDDDGQIFKFVASVVAAAVVLVVNQDMEDLSAEFVREKIASLPDELQPDADSVISCARLLEKWVV